MGLFTNKIVCREHQEIVHVRHVYTSEFVQSREEYKQQYYKNVLFYLVKLIIYIWKFSSLITGMKRDYIIHITLIELPPFFFIWSL